MQCGRDEARCAATMTANATLEEQGDTPRSMVGCLFCRFEDRSVNTIFAQSENFYARLDNFPAVDGHVEIVPKKHIVSFFELTHDEIAEAYGLMTKAQKMLFERYRPAGYTIGINEGRAAGRSVDHLHIHLIPRHMGDVADPRGGIRQILPNCRPDDWRAH